MEYAYEWLKLGYFVLSTSEFELQSELDFIYDQIRIAPHNEAPWVYLVGIVKLKGSSDMILDFCNEFEGNPFAQSVLLDAYKTLNMKEAYADTCTLLVTSDPVRRIYWEHKKSLF